MRVRLHPHVVDRMEERGATREKVVATVTGGERLGAKHGRIRFRRNFRFGGLWRGRRYLTKQVDAIAVEEAPDNWLVITIIVRYY